MPTYIRFETQHRCATFKRRLGVFRTAGVLRETTDMPGVTAQWLEDTIEWFNYNLIVPKYDRVDRRGVFWFRTEARAVINRMWELACILQDEGVLVDFVRTHRPGYIVYRDDQQVAAIPHRR